MLSKLPRRLRSFQTYCTIRVHRGEDMKSMDKL
ncbi:holin, partial [Escherichia coli]|nr:holin [Escherichia coli]